jgi:hypothetical protein
MQITKQLDFYRRVGITEVDGWGVDADLINLILHIHTFQEEHGATGSLCEIGVHHGKTLILLALLARPSERVVGIDLFEDRQAENLDSSGLGSLGITRANLSRYAESVSVECVTANSFDLTADQRALLAGARMFHIDGGHFLEVVLNDLEVAQRALGPGGVIIIDDYWNSLFPEVHEAVHRYFAAGTVLKAVPFMTGRNKIFLAHQSHRDRLLQYMKGQLPRERSRPVKLLGYDSICCDFYP